MIVELGLLLVTFLGSKANDSRQAAQKKQKAARAQEEEFEPAEPAEIVETKAELEQRQTRYLQASMGSMALFAAKPLIPGAVPLGMAAYLYGALPYMKDVEKALVRDKKVNVDVLFFVADALTLGVRSYFTAALGLTLIHHGKLMVKKARDDSAKLVTHLFEELPQSVWMLVDGAEVQVALTDVKVGDLLLVISGEVIPVDGVIEEGIAQIDQRALTGEAQPAEKSKGDDVFANTSVSTGRIQIRVTRSGTETTSAQISDMLLNSVSFKAGVQLKGERWADKMSLPTLAASMALLPFKGPVASVVLINAHIGARILLFAPLATLRHITEAAELGVLVKDGRALEQLSDVDTVLFDKTGTLTTDQPEVGSITPRNGNSASEILAYAATAQRKLSHPIAKAILKKAKAEGVTPYEVQDSNYKIGYGVTVRLKGKVVRVGSTRFFEQENIEIPEDVLAAKEKSHSAGNTFILIGIDQGIAGTLELQPQIRPEAKAIIAQLRELGIVHIAIVSGDERAPTKKLADELGVDEYFSNILPEGKAELVEGLQADGKVVCFVGDGINDTIALKKANVSISIAGATSIAKDNAEIIFMDGSLNNLPATVDLARRLETNLQRSLVVCLIPSAVNVLGALVFKFNILTALAVNIGFSALGVTKAFYVKKQETPMLEEPTTEKQLPSDLKRPVAIIPFPSNGPEIAALSWARREVLERQG